MRHRQAAASDDQASVPEVALPGSTGTVAAGKGSVAAAGSRSPDTRARAGAASEDSRPGSVSCWASRSPLSGRRRGEAGQGPPHRDTVPVLEPGHRRGLRRRRRGNDPARPAENTSLSTYSLSLTITTQSQYALTNRHDLRFSDDWGLTGMARWTKWPSPTWASAETRRSPRSRPWTTSSSAVRARQPAAVRRSLRRSGLQLRLVLQREHSGSASGQPTDFSTYPYGTGSTSLNSGPALSLSGHSRQPVYPTRGIVADFNYTFFPTWLGSGATWHNVYLDLRTYHQLAPWLVLALWTYGSLPSACAVLELASNVAIPMSAPPGLHPGPPYREIAALRRSGIPIHIWQWLGAVAGVNVHSVSDPEGSGILGTTQPSATGIRR